MKTAVLLEMLILAGGALLNLRYNQQQSWETVLVTTGLKRLIAILILTILLLAAVDVGLGAAAVAFGGLIATSYLIAAASWLGPTLQKAEQSLFGD